MVAQMNKPVALIRQSKYGTPSLVWNGEFKYQSTVVKWDDIPLYTHPVKELTKAEGFALTDEEIQQSIDIIDWNQSNVLIRFAKAILRKAQEK
jgi:hypothetical protein